jgi:EAL domain-containing protein (putative c-di-GMP-specific phosphodiesterase class I)/AmiR/NasT family two-component response regulator
MPTNATAAARIVVVDDQHANVALLQRILRHAGYLRVRGLTDPRSALEICTGWAPDLVILDLHMPDIDGVAFLETLRSAHAPTDFVPVLILTADITRDALKRALAAGANDYALKPLDADEVLLRVRNLLSIRVSHEALKHHNTTLAAELRDLTRWADEQALHQAQATARVRDAIASGGPKMVVQPIIELAARRTVGYEALARFDTPPQRPPDTWFADAAAVGLGTELELLAVQSALDLLPAISPDQFLTINVSPTTLLTNTFRQLALQAPCGRVVFEITEHQPVDDYEAVAAVSNALRGHGVRLAVDDAGAGFASMQHILKLQPDFIKLDIGFTRHIDRDPIKTALSGALASFAKQIGATIIAEGIETADELQRLRELDITYGQGYYLGVPHPIDHYIRPTTTRH